MNNHYLLPKLCLAISLVLCSLGDKTSYAQQEMGTLSYYHVSEQEIKDHYHEWATFLEYNLQREPCQKYQAPLQVLS